MNRYLGMLLLVFMVSCAGGCKKEPNNFEFSVDEKKIVISLTKVQDEIFDIQADVFAPDGSKTHSDWRLDYPVYRFDCADITGDGMPEIAVGVIKATRFDPIVRKRLFLFKLFDGCYVRPLWLGSKVSLPLVDFRLVNDGKEPRIRTIEQEGDNSFVVAEYVYKTFGVEWKGYLKRGLTAEEAEYQLKIKKIKNYGN
ncbi:MAG: nuclear receptor-binding factor 2 [Tannerella sp.]|nr:nuclear receptor-binding factor 2 [Tannerella sp.]